MLGVVPTLPSRKCLTAFLKFHCFMPPFSPPYFLPFCPPPSLTKDAFNHSPSYALFRVRVVLLVVVPWNRKITPILCDVFENSHPQYLWHGELFTFSGKKLWKMLFFCSIRWFLILFTLWSSRVRWLRALSAGLVTARSGVRFFATGFSPSALFPTSS